MLTESKGGWKFPKQPSIVTPRAGQGYPGACWPTVLMFTVKTRALMRLSLPLQLYLLSIHSWLLKSSPSVLTLTLTLIFAFKISLCTQVSAVVPLRIMLTLAASLDYVQFCERVCVLFMSGDRKWERWAVSRCLFSWQVKKRGGGEGSRHFYCLSCVQFRGQV